MERHRTRRKAMAKPDLPPALARRLDDAFVGPDEAAWRRARAALQTRLDKAGGLVYYDRVPATPVGPLWVAVTDRGLAAVEFG